MAIEAAKEQKTFFPFLNSKQNIRKIGMFIILVGGVGGTPYKKAAYVRAAYC
ncbi:MAG: hypothetical protein ACQEWV_32805 [Bacillota bacterium]